MKRSFAALLFVPLVISACGSGKEKALTDNEIKQKVDSLVGVKVEALNRQSMEDLDRRLSIEVKQKADSMVQARMAGIHPDTTQPAANNTTKPTPAMPVNGEK
jgi:hypothetical protein